MIKRKTWSSLTVKQFQDVYKVIHSKEILSDDKEFAIVAALNGLTLEQVDELPLDQYKQLRAEAAFIHEPLPAKGSNVIKTPRRDYRIIYNMLKLNLSQHKALIDSLCNSEADIVSNLHVLAACIVRPHKGVLNFTSGSKKADALKVEDVAEDLLQARYIDVYHAAVYYFNVMRGYTIVTKEQFIEGLIGKGKTREEAIKYHEELERSFEYHAADNNLPQIPPSVLKQLDKMQSSFTLKSKVA